MDEFLHLSFVGTFNICIKCTFFLLHGNHYFWFSCGIFHQKNHFPLIKGCTTKCVFWGSWITFRSWISFILDEFRLILRECFYKINIKHKVLNKVLNVVSYYEFSLLWSCKTRFVLDVTFSIKSPNYFN